MTFFLTYVPFVIFTGAHSVQSFDVSKEREHCRIGQHRYLVDLPEHDCSIILRFSQHQGIGIETICVNVVHVLIAFYLTGLASYA